MTQNVNNAYPTAVSMDMAAYADVFVQGQPVALGDYRQLHLFENFLAINLLPPGFRPRLERRNAIYQNFDQRTHTVDLMRGKIFSGNLQDLSVIKYDGDPEEFQAKWHITDSAYSSDKRLSDNCLDFLVTAAAQKMGRIVGELVMPVRIKRINNNKRSDIIWKRLVGPVEGTDNLVQAHNDSVKRAITVEIINTGRTKSHHIDRSFEPTYDWPTYD